MTNRRVSSFIVSSFAIVCALHGMEARADGARAPSPELTCAQRVSADFRRDDVIRNIDGTCSIIQPRVTAFGTEALLAINGDIGVMCDLAGFGPGSGVDVRPGTLAGQGDVVFVARESKDNGGKVLMVPETSNTFVRTLTCR